MQVGSRVQLAVAPDRFGLVQYESEDNLGKEAIAYALVPPRVRQAGGTDIDADFRVSMSKNYNVSEG